MYKSLEETQLIIVEKLEDLKCMIKDLENYDEIAIDLEHHSYRSFLGITCLIQISTKDTDYLVDSLALRSELNILNEIFTKPSILKVFHGADSDIQWLQRDFSLYVVNMFDTYQAAKQLELPFLSLAYLMKTYCNINPNKHFQLADWRIRPLPDELVKYAREDTHYLLYIKDILRNSLIDSSNGEDNILKAVYSRSLQICKIVYIKPIWTEDSYMNIYRKSQKNFNNKQLFVLKELHKWRDQTAREEDDSTNYVLPNHMLLNIAENLPREMQGVLACCNPIPPLVRQNLLKIHKMILKGREQSLIKPILETEIKQRLNQRSQVSKSYSWIYTPHDLPSNMEIRTNLPCLLRDDKKAISSFIKNKIKYISIFDSSSEDESENKNEKLNKKRKLIFISPFKRYKLTLPVITDAEEKEKNKKEKDNPTKGTKEITVEIDDSKNRVYDHFKKVAEETDKRKKEISESISRVHEHFKKISDKTSDKKQEKLSRLNKEIIKNSILDSPAVKSFNQMKGKKRKRNLNSKS